MRTNDGTVLAATSAVGIVAELRLASRTGERSDRAFMRAAAERAEMMTGKQVRSDTPENFVADLLAAGLLIED